MQMNLNVLGTFAQEQKKGNWNENQFAKPRIMAIYYVYNQHDNRIKSQKIGTIDTIVEPVQSFPI